MRTLRLVNSLGTGQQLSFDAGDGAERTDIGGALFSVKAFLPGAYSPRVDPQPRYGRSGGIATGDREVGPASFILELDVTAQADSDYRLAMARILGHFKARYSPVYLYDDQDDTPESGGRLPLRCIVELQSEALVQNRDGLWARHMSGPLQFSMPDAFWEDAEAIEYASPSGGLEDQDTFVLPNDSYEDAFPVFTLTAQDTNSLFRLTNQTTGVWVEIGSSDFVTGEELTISCVDGRVTIDGVNIAASALSDGSAFPSLVPGNNTFQYSSAFGNIDLAVEYRRRFPR